MKTASVKQKDIKKDWLLIDAKDQTVGRLSTEIARLLRGKHKPSFVPHLDCGDSVVVVNAEKVHFTGLKWDDKNYYHHTGYIGGIKSVTARELRDKHPERILRNAVKGMLPKNKLSSKLLKNLRIYAGSEHPHAAQNLKPAPSRLVKGDA